MDFVGRGSIARLEEIAKGNVLLFTQTSIFEIFGEILQSKLRNTSLTKFTSITENPKRDEIQSAQDLFRGSDFDFIIAFGGGSVIDFAKAFKFYDKRNSPLIAIPTTAGTGSQATQFAVVYIDGIKTSLDDPKILPDFAIADSQFVEAAPRYLKACSAIDAYCQAIESFWAVRANAESRKYALEAIAICRDWIIEAVNTPGKQANEMMVKASHLAGKAINISRTTAAHALSYKITSEYGIPHGHAVALTIAQVFNANLCRIADENILLDALKITRDSINDYFTSLMETLGLEHDLRKLGISDFDAIAESVNPERLGNNPRAFTRQELANLFKTGISANEI